MKKQAGGKSPQFKKAVKDALKAKVPKEMEGIKEILDAEGIKNNNTNAIAAAVVLKALKGDLSAVNWVRDAVAEENEEVAQESGVVIIRGEEDLSE